MSRTLRIPPANPVQRCLRLLPPDEPPFPEGEMPLKIKAHNVIMDVSDLVLRGFNVESSVCHGILGIPLEKVFLISRYHVEFCECRATNVSAPPWRAVAVTVSCFILMCLYVHHLLEETEFTHTSYMYWLLSLPLQLVTTWVLFSDLGWGCRFLQCHSGVPHVSPQRCLLE